MNPAADTDDATGGDGRLLGIGDFGRLARLSPKALRIYDDVGLLRPAAIDPSTGYRRYRPEQLDSARLIRLLRSVDVGLAEIAELLAEIGTDRTRAADRLRRHLASLEATHSSRRLPIRHVHAIIREEPETMFTIETRHVDAQRVMSIQRRLHADETDAFVREVKAAFAAHLGEVAPTGPFTLIFHGIVDSESDGPLEAILGCPAEIQPSETIGIRTEPAHDEAYTTITKAEWAYPAILAAYDAVAGSTEARARAGSRLSCREVYVAEPDDIGDDDLVCDIAFPLA